MSTTGQQGGDGQTAPSAGPPSPSLGQLKEALRVLEQTQHLFNNIKAKVVYACGEGQLLASDDGRQYLARVIKSLDDEHRMVRAGWPRLAAALEVARAVNKAATARGAAGTGGPTGQAARGSAGTAAAATGEAASAALQSHCRSVLQLLESALCEEMLARGGTQLGRPAKRQRTGEVAQSPPAAASPTASSPSAPAATPAPHYSHPYATTTATSAPSSLQGGPEDLLGVLLRIQALDGFRNGTAPSGAGPGGSGPGAGAAVGSLSGMRMYALDDGGNPLHLPSALTEALRTAAVSPPPPAASAAAGAAAGAAGGGGGGGSSGAGGRAMPLGAVPLVDAVLLARGAARLGPATQVRVLLPGVFAAAVLLEAPGCAAPLRVAVDCADRAFEMDPWATPTTQVFRRLSALATRVLAYYTKRAPISTAPRPEAPPGPGQAHGSPPPAPPLPLSEPVSPGAAALEELLLWLLTCRDLFSKRCAATGRLMAWDPSVQYPVPPIFRAFKLPREELRLRAADLSRVVAYHMHAAPVEQLGWAEDVPAEAVQALALREGETAAAAAAPAAVAVGSGTSTPPHPWRGAAGGQGPR